MEVERSLAFLEILEERLYEFLVEAREDEIRAMKALRAWWTEQTEVYE